MALFHNVILTCERRKLLINTEKSWKNGSDSEGTIVRSHSSEISSYTPVRKSWIAAIRGSPFLGVTKFALVCMTQKNIMPLKTLILHLLFKRELIIEDIYFMVKWSKVILNQTTAFFKTTDKINQKFQLTSVHAHLLTAKE